LTDDQPPAEATWPASGEQTMTNREFAGLVLEGVGRAMTFIADAFAPAELGAIALVLLAFRVMTLGV